MTNILEKTLWAYYLFFTNLTKKVKQNPKLSDSLKIKINRKSNGGLIKQCHAMCERVYASVNKKQHNPITDSQAIVIFC